MPDLSDFRARDVVLGDGMNIHYFQKPVAISTWSCCTRRQVMAGCGN